MIPLPDPLHPAVVHFPIALLVVSVPVAVAAVFIRRWHLALWAALLLSLGATGAVVATATGRQQEERVGESSETVERVMEEHEEWGETARNAALAAAALAVAAVFTVNVRFAGRTLAVAAAVATAVAAYAVAEAGHYGGELVYRHSAGVGIGATTAPGATDGLVPSRPRHDDDD